MVVVNVVNVVAVDTVVTPHVVVVHGAVVVDGSIPLRWDAFWPGGGALRSHGHCCCLRRLVLLPIVSV